MCEYNLNLTADVAGRVEYVGHFAGPKAARAGEPSDLERLIGGEDYGYWMRTGNRSTNDGTGRRYEEAFSQDGMSSEKRIISHARDDPGIDRVISRDGKRYSIAEALDKKIDWIQIDVGFLTERQKESVLDGCGYAVVNGSHTVMGEIMGGRARPVIGIPVYDEHTNNIRWADERGLGVLARGTSEVIGAIARIRGDRSGFESRLQEFARNFASDGARNAARIAAEMLEEKR